MKVLFLSRWYPDPPDNGSKIRILNLLRSIAPSCDITLLSFADQPDINLDAPSLRALCPEIHVVPWKAYEPDSWRARLGFLSTTPRSIVDTFSLEMAHKVRELLASGRYDVSIASQFTSASYGPWLQGVPAIFEELELGIFYEDYAYARTPWHRVRNGLTWFKQRQYVGQLLQYFNACTVVSEREQELLSLVNSDYSNVEVVPNCVDVASYRDVVAALKPNTIIFTGSFSYFPNYQAMIWFTREVLPRVQAEIGSVHLRITGDHQNRPLPHSQNVILTGYVDDIRPLVASSWLSIAPIWHGGGTRLKILEAMALRTPVIATSKGAEGLDVEHGENILIADTAEAFVEATLRLLQDAALRQRLSDNGYQLVCEKYDWDRVSPRFLHLMEQVARS